ncbi:MAG: hypothetical protein ABSC29_01705 [Minisyncoccia bacterium]|jgi:hypothetical protein
MNWQDLSPWITPAIILSIAAYFTHLFGKIIADQKAFTDNRDWEIEFSGLWFLADFLLPPGIIAIGTLLRFKDFIMGWASQIPAYVAPVNYHWIDFAIIFLIGSYCTVAASILGKGKYGLPNPDPEINKDAAERIFDRVTNINTIFLQIFSMFVIFIFALELLSGSIFWISIFSVQVFSVFILIALNYSLMRHSAPRADIYFNGKTKPLLDVLLLKVNDDNIKIRTLGKTSFLNRDEVLKWEILDDHQKKNANAFMIPFISWLPWLLTLYLFWQNKLLLGILVAVGFPVVLIAFRFLFVPFSHKKMTVIEFENSYGQFSTLSSAASIIGSASAVIGSLAAWFHNFPLAMTFGVLITFVAWGVLQIDWLPKSTISQKSG